MYDFAASVVRSAKNKKGGKEFAPKSATWFQKLQHAMTRTPQAVGGGGGGGGTATPVDWVPILTNSLLAAGVQWVPGATRSRLTAMVAIKLQGTASAEATMVGRPGSLQRAAEEARIRQQKWLELQAMRAKGAVMNFGCDVPFTNVPALVREGYAKAERKFGGKGDGKVLNHYLLAVTCLAANLGDPACDLMLLLTLTLCASSETPQVDARTRRFGVAGKRRDPSQLALVLITRMLWHLYPASFPWAKGSGKTAHDVAEMTKKIEHTGCNNRMLCELGWVTASSNRDNPRNAEVKIQPREMLVNRLRDLKRAFKRPDEFVANVFSSDDPLWADRCASIIKRREHR